MRTPRRRIEALGARADEEREEDDLEEMYEWLRSLTPQGRDEVRAILEQAEEDERAGRPVDEVAAILALLEVARRDEERRGISTADGVVG